MRGLLPIFLVLAAACHDLTTGPSELAPLTDSAAAALGKETPPFAYAMLTVFQQHGVAPQIFVHSLEASAPATPTRSSAPGATRRSRARSTRPARRSIPTTMGFPMT